MKIAIIDYRSGNLHSALKSFQAAASDLKNVSVKVTSCYKDVIAADRLVLPGVGSFSFCKSKLLENGDVFKAICARQLEITAARATSQVLSFTRHGLLTNVVEIVGVR